MEVIEFLVCGNADASSTIEKLKTLIIKDEAMQISNLSEETLCDYLYEEVDEDAHPEFFETIKSRFSFHFSSYDYNVTIKRFTMGENRFLKCKIETDETTDIENICNSEWLVFRTELVEIIYQQYKEIHWLSDTQNKKISTDLYSKMHEIENFLRSVIDEYMCIKHGGTWFEKYSYEDYVNKYLKFSEWFRKSDYEVFKKIDNHLYNLEISDIFEALKHAKKITLSKKVINSLKTIRDDESNIEGIINTDVLDEPSLWDEEQLDKVFPKNVVSRWDCDFSKRRNMVAHNKLICIDMYKETISEIDFFKNEFIKSQKILFKRLNSSEENIIKTAARDYDISYNMEFCGFSEDFRDADSLMDRLMDEEKIIELHGILEDDIKSLIRTAEDAYDYVTTIYENILESYFFNEDNEFVGEELIQQYLQVLEEHPIYENMCALVEKGLSYDTYKVLEHFIKESLNDIKNNLSNIVNLSASVDLKSLSEGTVAKFASYNGNIYELNVYGEICPDRGSSDELKISLNENGEEICEGFIYISYGDYEIVDDCIPIPSSSEGIATNITDVVSQLKSIIEEECANISKIADAASDVEV